MPQETSQVASPVASIPTGTIVEKNTTVTLSSATANAAIFYTLDGSEPAIATGLEYTQPIAIVGDVTIRAMSVKEGMRDSEVAAFTYQVNSVEIEQVEKERIVVYALNHTLYIRGLKAKDVYTVYSVLGHTVFKGIAGEGEESVHLPCGGLYIVVNKSNSVKILVP
jgi:hypothetical protein